MIKRQGETLLMEGSPEALAILAQNIEFLAASQREEGDAQGRDEHTHIEYYDNHPFLSSEAEPLTVCLA